MKQPLLFLDQTSCWGGAQRVLVDTLRALEREFVPLVALPEDGLFAAELRRRNIETLIFPLGRYRSGRKSCADMMAFPPRSLYCGLHLARTIRRRNVRLVYINGPRCLVAGLFAARLTGRPCLFHLHLTMTRTADIFVAALAARYATKTVVCCEAAARALLKRNPHLDRTLQVIYNPAPKLLSGVLSSPRGFDSAPSCVDWSHPIVGMVGRITPQKGQHVLLRAAARLVSRGRDVRVLIVGSPDSSCPEDSSYLRSLESSVREWGLEGKVQWPGYQDDPNPYYALLDVLVIPSTTSEGLPLVALEAMRWAIPVIASRVGGIPEVIRHGVNGLLVPPGDEGALAESLERILSDPALRSRLGLEARASLDSRFSVDTFNNSIRSVVSQLCRRGGTPVNEAQTGEPEAGI